MGGTLCFYCLQCFVAGGRRPALNAKGAMRLGVQGVLGSVVVVGDGGDGSAVHRIRRTSERVANW